MKFKNIAGKDLFLRGFGLVKKDAIIETKELKNPNFQEVKEVKETKK